MAALSVQTLADAGTPPTFGAASTSDTSSYGSGSNTFAVYKNGDSVTHTLTIPVVGNTNYGRPLPAATYTIAAGAQVWVPLRRDYDNGIVAGQVTLNLDAATSVTVAIVRVA